MPQRNTAETQVSVARCTPALLMQPLTINFQDTACILAESRSQGDACSGDVSRKYRQTRGFVGVRQDSVIVVGFVRRHSP